MTALVLGAAATWAMVGLIWFVQLVHYPLLARFSAATPGATIMTLLELMEEQVKSPEQSKFWPTILTLAPNDFLEMAVAAMLFAIALAARTWVKSQDPGAVALRKREETLAAWNSLSRRDPSAAAVYSGSGPGAGPAPE